MLGPAAIRAARGDLDDVDALARGTEGCDVVFHAAAHTDQFDPLEVHMRITARGTDNALAAANRAGVARFVHVSTEAVLADGAPIIRADETRPIPEKALGAYPLTKALAEKAAIAASAAGFATIVVRPRFVWGLGDTSLLPEIAHAVKSGGPSSSRPKTSTPGKKLSRAGSHARLSRSRAE